MIYGLTYSQVPANSPLPQHNSYGTFQIDLFKPSSVVVLGDVDYLVLGHGILMALAWVVCAPFGVFVARYLKNRMGSSWFSWHRGIFLLVACLTILGFGLIEADKGGITSSNLSTHFTDIHGIIGLVICFAMLVQIILGYVIDKLWNSERTAPPLHDKIHWWFGRIVALLAIVNLYLGVIEYGSSIGLLIAVAGFLTVIVIASFVYGQRKVGDWGGIHHIQTTRGILDPKIF
jgi:hypothetical protein